MVFWAKHARAAFINVREGERAVRTLAENVRAWAVQSIPRGRKPRRSIS
jgi:hypothetical protein